jgi:hypothetical protein
LYDDSLVEPIKRYEDNIKTGFRIIGYEDELVQVGSTDKCSVSSFLVSFCQSLYRKQSHSPSICVVPLGYETKFHTRTEQQVKKEVKLSVCLIN